MSSFTKIKKKPEEIFPAIQQLKQGGSRAKHLLDDKQTNVASLKASAFGHLLNKAGIK